MAKRKTKNPLKYGEPMVRRCVWLPESLDKNVRDLLAKNREASSAIVDGVRIAVKMAQRVGKNRVSARGGVKDHLDVSSDSRALLAPCGPFRLVRLIDGNDIELPNSTRSTLMEAERLQRDEMAKTDVTWEIRGGE